MASADRKPTASLLSTSPFPFATAPDIIRAHQKDAYFQGLLTNQLADLHRRLLGVRSSHAWATEARTVGDLLYLCLTTLLGNRTLGEEYCDLIQVEAPPPSTGPLPDQTSKQATSLSGSSSSRGGPALPSLRRRASYISLSILLPYALTRLLPTLRARLRTRLEARLAHLNHTHQSASLEYRAKRYLLTHLHPLTSGAHIHALVLASFYFSGAYYSLSKRLTGLRYVFTRRLPSSGSGSGTTAQGSVENGRAGYEVLGVLLVVQLAVQGYLHVRQTLAAEGEEASVEAAIRERAWGNSRGSTAPVADVSLDHEYSYNGNNDLLLQTGGVSGSGSGAQRNKRAIGLMAHTPVVGQVGGPGSGGGGGGGGGDGVRFDLRDDGVLGWIKGRSQRKCTLCLEELKDPSATGCGHVFCWTCIGDWVREKPECPLCRREVMIQHILPLRPSS